MTPPQVVALMFGCTFLRTCEKMQKLESDKFENLVPYNIIVRMVTDEAVLLFRQD